jgi:hypothetical protein
MPPSCWISSRSRSFPWPASRPRSNKRRHGGTTGRRTGLSYGRRLGRAALPSVIAAWKAPPSAAGLFIISERFELTILERLAVLVDESWPILFCVEAATNRLWSQDLYRDHSHFALLFDSLLVICALISAGHRQLPIARLSPEPCDFEQSSRSASVSASAHAGRTDISVVALAGRLFDSVAVEDGDTPARTI